MSLTFKDRENIIRSYGKDYKKSKLIELKGIEVLNSDLVSEKDEKYIINESNYHYYYGVQNKIDRVLEKMDYDDANFIRCEFLSNNYRPDWWRSYFSRSTYYRLKKRSMENFLRMIYD